MRKVLIIGPGGAGKSTLARRIGACAGLPVVHLDQYYWQPGWVEPSPEAWRTTVRRLVEQDAWVMDGNYSGTLDLRLAACDTVVFLDLPRWVCLARVVRRRFAFHNRSRPDMAVHCPERLTWEFVWWIWTYRRTRRQGLLQKLGALPPGTDVIVLTAQADVERFVTGLSQKAG